MPEASTGTDYYLYKYLCKPIAKKICFIHPNIITTIGLLLAIPLYFNIVNKGKMLNAILLIIAIIFMDCLDGSVARSCDTGSDFGALYDILTDAIKVVIIAAGICLYIFKLKKQKLIHIILVIFIILYILLFAKQLYDEIKGNRSKKGEYFYTSYHKFIHDNCMIFNVLAIYIIKSICK